MDPLLPALEPALRILIRSWNLQPFTDDDILQTLRDLQAENQAPPPGRDDLDFRIRCEEYVKLTDLAQPQSQDFQTARGQVPAAFSPWIDTVILVERLKEVRVLLGFTRVNPPPAGIPCDIALPVPNQPGGLQLARWVPGSETRGEGLLVVLRPDRVRAWESQPAVIQRANLIITEFTANRPIPAALQGRLSARFIMLHTLAHLFLRQLSLDCGYSSTALRERIYCNPAAPAQRDDPPEMAAFLVYTAANDSDGSLGGLIMQGRDPGRIEMALRGVVEQARLCSADSLCSGRSRLRRTLAGNGASCHACTLVSETSCEFFNRLLDRSLLITPAGSASATGFLD
jgi:hypothetical protein